MSEDQTVSKAQRDQIVIEHLPLVRAIAARVHENLPVHVELDDLIHAGVMGLFDAATRYDPEKQVIFHSYAKHRIKGAILDSLRQADWASRDLRKRQKQVESTTRDLAAKLGRTPTEAEVADGLGITLDHWRQVAMQLRTVGTQRGNEQDDFAPPECPARPEFQPDNICSHAQLRKALQEAIQTLPARYQKVVSLYYTSEMTMKEIGSLLGVNESRVSQIHKIALEKMASALHSAGIHSSGAF